MKKNLIIIFLIFTSVYSSATFWNQSRFSFYNSHDTEVYGAENNFLSEFMYDRLNIQIQMNTLYSEEGFDDPNSYITNELRTLSTYHLAENSKFLIGYNLDYYDYDKTKNNFIIDGIYLTTQPLVKNYLYLYTQNEWESVSFLAGVRGRRTGIDYQFDISDAINSAEAEYYDEFYKDIALAYQFNSDFLIYSTYENKTFYNSVNSFVDPYRNHDYTHYGLGVNYTSNSFLGGRISEDFQYLNKESQQYQSYQRHNFINNLRYNYFLNPYISSFISYISQFSYDKEDKEFYRLANYARAQLRFNIPSYNYKAFVIAGSSISFENLSRIYFAYVEYPLSNSFSLSLEDRYSHNVYNTIIASMDYKINNNFLVYIENNYVQSLRKIDNFEFENTYDFKNTFTLGTRMLFR